MPEPIRNFRWNDPQGKNDANDPVLKLVGSGQYRDIPGNIVNDYMTAKISQEQALAAIKGTPVYSPATGPQMDIGYGKQPYDATKMNQNAILNDAKARLSAIQEKLPNQPMTQPAPAPMASPQQGTPTGQTQDQNTGTPNMNPGGVDPQANAAAQSILHASFKNFGSDADVGSGAKFLEMFKQLLPGMSGSTTSQPSAVDTRHGLNAQYGVDQAMNDVQSAKEALRNIDNTILAKANDIKSQQGPQITSAVINGQLAYLDSKTAAARQQALTQVQNATDLANAKMGMVESIMSDYKFDWQNAHQAVSEQWDRAFKIFDAFTSLQGKDDAKWNTALSTTVELMKDRPQAFLNMTPDQQSWIRNVEVHNRLPQGFLQGYAAIAPKGKAITHVDSKNGVVVSYTIDPITQQPTNFQTHKYTTGTAGATNSAFEEYRKAMALSRRASAINATIKTLYPTSQANPINMYASGAQWVNKLEQAYMESTDKNNTAKNVSDLELIDAAVKIDNGGQQITEPQVNTLLSGASIPARATVEAGKLVGISAILTDEQRKTIKNLAQKTLNGQYKLAQNAVDLINKRLTKLGFGKNELLDSPEDVSTYANIANDTSTNTKANDIASLVQAAGYDYEQMKADGYSDEEITSALNP